MVHRRRSGRRGDEIAPGVDAEQQYRYQRKGSDRHRRPGKSAPVAAGRERDRQQQPEMRLVAERTEQQPGDERPAIDQQGRRAEQAGGKE